MLLEFKLSMPKIGSWNGKWTGEEKYYAKVINFTKKYGKGKEAIEKLETVKGSFCYNFGDGWSACVDVKEIDSKEASKIRRKSNGFCGYEWMIESILTYGKIICPKG